MDDNSKTRINDALCTSVLTVQNYLQSNCTDSACPFYILLSRVREQTETERLQRQEAEKRRIVELENRKIESDIE